MMNYQIDNKEAAFLPDQEIGQEHPPPDDKKEDVRSSPYIPSKGCPFFRQRLPHYSLSRWQELIEPVDCKTFSYCVIFILSMLLLILGIILIPSFETPPHSSLFRTNTSVLVQRVKRLAYSYDWSSNTFLQNIEHTAQLLNITDCWVCSYIPANGQQGIPLCGVPYNETGLKAMDALWRESNRSAFIHLSVLNPAPVCIRRNGTEKKFTLGAYPLCNSLFDMPGTCINRSSGISNGASTTYAMWSWLTAEQKGFCRDMEVAINYTRQINASIALPDGSWFLCGHSAYREIPLNWTGVCTLGRVVPHLDYFSHLPQGRIRNKRLLPLLVAGVIFNSVQTIKLSNWTTTMFNDSIKIDKMMNKQLEEIRQIVLQNRYALDIMLAAKGGVCALMGPKCCTFISDYQTNISNIIARMEESVQSNPVNNISLAILWDSLWSWLPDGSWLRSILMTLIMIVCVMIAFCCCLQCIPTLLFMCRNLTVINNKNVLHVEQSKPLLQALEPVHFSSPKAVVTFTSKEEDSAY